MKIDFSIKTLSIYAVGCLFIAMSIYGLGNANIMVGGFGVFLLKAIANKDFSIKPLTSIINITVYTLAIAILPFIVNLNIYTGLIINFVSIFLILYMLVYSLKETIYVPFLLGYSFFLTDKANGHEFKLRIIGLIIVAIVSVIFQIILNKFQGKNTALNNLTKSLSFTDSLISEKMNNGDFSNAKSKLQEHNLSWNKDILNHKQNEFYLNKEENVQLNLISAIRTLKFKIEKFSNSSAFDLNDAKDLLKKLSDFSKGKYKRYLLVEDFSYFNNKYSKNINLDNDAYEIKESFNVLFVLVVNFYDMQHGTIKVSKRSKLRDYIELERNLFRDFRRGSSRFTFSFRTALLISLTYFFMSLFDVELGKWAIYTIVSISQPYYDVTKQKAFDRLVGTAIGGVIFTVLNIIFTGFNARLIVIFISIYFVVFFVDYSRRIIASTVMALMIVSISSQNMLLMTLDRLLFVFIGVIIVLIGSILILPYRLETEIYDLTNVYFETCQNAINAMLHIYDNDEKLQEINNLVLEANNIEAKLLVKNSAYDIKILNEFISDGRIILDTIHKIINRVFYYDSSLLENKYERVINLNHMKEDIDKLSQIDFENSNLETIISKYMKVSQNKGELLIYKDMYDILIANRRLNYLKKNMDANKKQPKRSPII